MGFDPVTQPADNAYALTMAVIIVGMIASLFGTLLYFRWRAAHPLAEPDSVLSVLGGDGRSDGVDADGSLSNEEPWQRSADWWRSDEDQRDS